MSFQTPITTRHPVCPVELKLGRIDWTRADYLALGRETWDAKYRKNAHGSASLIEATRENYAVAFADIAMPAYKLGVRS